MVRDYGAAVMGRYGSALEPGQRPSTRMLCPRGTVLGNDNLCYNKIANKDRKWPKGRAPLLTGGERNAISKAARASRKIQSTTKQLQKLGMLPKPGRGRSSRKNLLANPRNITVVDT